MKKVEKTAKNLDEALSLAAKELGAEKSELSYEVLQEVGKGLLGFLVGKEITISAWLKKDEAEPKQSAPIKSEKTKTIPAKPVATKEPAKAVKSESKKSATVHGKNTKTSVSKNINLEETKADSSHLTKSTPLESVSTANKHSQKSARTPAKVNDEITNELKAFLSDLLNKMGITHQLNITVKNDVVTIDVSGEKMGFLIGKRGETLDAVQYITSLFINKGKEGYIKINIDTENYRQKREETLIRLAHGLERRVISSRRPVTLEPMSPYERRIIHATLQNNPKIRTYSVGDEPNRKIVVTPS